MKLQKNKIKATTYCRTILGCFLLCVMTTSCSAPDTTSEKLPKEDCNIFVLESLHIPSSSHLPFCSQSLLSLRAEALIAQYEAFPFGRFSLISKTDSLIPNSNLCNMGLLCEGYDNTIYYALPYDHSIYQDNAEGSARKKIIDQDGDLLQFHQGQLYYTDKETRLIYAYDPVTETTAPVLEKRTGHFMIYGRSLYYVGEGGIFHYNLDTKKEELLVNTGSFTPIWTAMTDDVLIYTLIDEADPSLLPNALLFAYSFQDQTSYYLCHSAWMPLLTGAYVYYQNHSTFELESLNLNDGEVISYGINTNRPSLDQNLLYFRGSASQPLMTYDLSTGETISCFSLEEDINCIYLYQTLGYVYLYLSDGQIYYYNKTDGFYGKL